MLKASTSNAQLPFSYLNGGLLLSQTGGVGTSSQAQSHNEISHSFVAPIFDDDDDLMMDAVSRVRLVQFQKDTEEPMGITLKVNSCFHKRTISSFTAKQAQLS